jgi:phosphohistidine phosphatase
MRNERILVVLRHAKATHHVGFLDVDRPLTDRGRNDATAAGRWLLAAALIPDLVLCSSSVRTRETWQHVGAEFAGPGGPVEVTYDPRLYDADTRKVFDVVREVPDRVGGLLIVGHNPSAQQLVIDLTGDNREDFPTSALAVIGLRTPWAEAVPGDGELTQFWTPRSVG